MEIPIPHDHQTKEEWEQSLKKYNDMRIQTLKEDLKRKADYANTATQVTNRIVKECRKCAEEGMYVNFTHIEVSVVDKVLANLRNEFTDLKVEQDNPSDNWHTISWED
jgi:hypothetical protein